MASLKQTLAAGVWGLVLVTQKDARCRREILGPKARSERCLSWACPAAAPGDASRLLVGGHALSRPLTGFRASAARPRPPGLCGLRRSRHEPPGPPSAAGLAPHGQASLYSPRLAGPPQFSRSGTCPARGAYARSALELVRGWDLRRTAQRTRTFATWCMSPVCWPRGVCRGPLPCA